MRNRTNIWTAEVIEIVERGQEFDIIGRDAESEWWQICCIRKRTGLGRSAARRYS